MAIEPAHWQQTTLVSNFIGHKDGMQVFVSGEIKDAVQKAGKNHFVHGSVRTIDEHLPNPYMLRVHERLYCLWIIVSSMDGVIQL